MTQTFYTLPEAAEYLRMAINTFRKHRPAIGGTKLGKHWLFTESELLIYVGKNRSKPISELKSAS